MWGSTPQILALVTDAAQEGLGLVLRGTLGPPGEQQPVWGSMRLSLSLALPRAAAQKSRQSVWGGYCHAAIRTVDACVHACPDTWYAAITGVARQADEEWKPTCSSAVKEMPSIVGQPTKPGHLHHRTVTNTGEVTQAQPPEQAVPASGSSPCCNFARTLQSCIVEEHVLIII